MIASLGWTMSSHKNRNSRWLFFLHYFCHSPPSLRVSHLLFCSFRPSLWAFLQFTWWADGQQTNVGPGPRQPERTQSSRAEQQGCCITFRMIPLQRLLTVPHQQHRFSERDDSCLKMSAWRKTAAAGRRSEQRKQPSTWSHARTNSASFNRKRQAVCGAF